MNWLQCDDCEHVFTDGYFGEDINKVLFAKTKRDQTPGWEPELNRSISGRIIERVGYELQTSGPLGKWLDIGFGNGALLAAAQEWGFEPVGVDARADAVDLLNAQGIRAYHSLNGKLPRATKEPKFDVISLADVLEHVPYPHEALKDASGVIKPGGVLFISCPNMACQAWHITTADNQNPYWSEIEHFHNFTRARLTKLLEDHGFSARRYGVSERYRMGMEIIAIAV